MRNLAAEVDARMELWAKEMCGGAYVSTPPPIGEVLRNTAPSSGQRYNPMRNYVGGRETKRAPVQKIKEVSDSSQRMDAILLRLRDGAAKGADRAIGERRFRCLVLNYTSVDPDWAFARMYPNLRRPFRRYRADAFNYLCELYKKEFSIE